MDGAGLISSGVVGPNTVTQLAHALEADAGRAMAEAVFAAAGWRDLLDEPPTAMIEETIPAALFDALWATLPTATAAAIAADAGRRTADYVIAHRIPSVAKAGLAVLPRRIGARLLLKAIQRNAWTFAGSGTFKIKPGPPFGFGISGNPMPTPGAIWHRAVFERMFQRLVSRRITLKYAGCACAFGRCCKFEINLAGDAA